MRNQSLIGDGEYVVLRADGDRCSESESDWKGATLMTGLTFYPDRGMPPELVQFELPMEDPEFLAQIKLGRTVGCALRREEAVRVVAPAPSKAFTCQGKALKLPGVTWADALRARGARPRFRLQKRAPPLKPDASLAAPEVRPGSFRLLVLRPILSGRKLFLHLVRSCLEATGFVQQLRELVWCS